jgi:hypothetical protein
MPLGPEVPMPGIVDRMIAEDEEAWRIEAA